MLRPPGILTIRREYPQLYEALKDVVEQHNLLEERTLAAGTPLKQGDFVLSSGFGSQAAVGSISGTQRRGRFTVTANGSGIAANPTVMLKFASGLWQSAPFAMVVRNGGSQPTALPKWTESITELVITFQGTPVAAETYTFQFEVRE